MKIEQLGCGLYRVLVPFLSVTTTVYIVFGEDGVAVIDAATTCDDVREHILPALAELGIATDDVRYLLLTHDHEDHAGGAPYLMEQLPLADIGCAFAREGERVKPIVDGEVIIGRLQVVSLPGHTPNSVAFLDMQTKTLLSGDCLQLKGIGKFRNGVVYPTLYRASVERLMDMDIDRIVAAHEYDPLGSIAEGREAVRRYLETCLNVL